jgi:DNA-binding CsgD family transcriptional regulator/tetratricopeptide (TPR) repeat protein
MPGRWGFPGADPGSRAGSVARDTSDMRARLTSTHFVGRVGELAELELAWAEADAGRPVLVLLGGESGVGKTRLVTEFEHRLADQGSLVLRGEGLEQGETELPYAPLLSALRPLVRERHPALESLSPATRSHLATLLPALDDGRGRADAQDPSAQLRLFEALLELLDVLSESQPLALVLEDMHWADRSTRTFVAFLTRSMRQERVLLLLTFRTDELHRRHALRPLLSEVERLERARRIDLARFDRAELVEALTDILGDSPDEGLAERLFARSEGNALFIEELLAAGLDGRGTPPQSLRDAFMLRIERLSADAQQAARAIAAGGRLDEATIAEVTGLESAALNAALREAVAEQVLVAGGDGRLFFRHALLREALYDDLLPGERGELHLRLAQAFEWRATDTREVELAALVASHYDAAGDQPAALRSTIRAALAARRVHAYGETADLAERALELWPRVPEPVQTAGIDQVELLVLAAGAHGIAGDRSRAEVLLQSALRELDSEQDPRRYSAVLARLARTQWSLNRGLEGVETAQRALSMLPAGEESRERASLLAWLARTRVLRGRFRDAVKDGREALAAAVAAGDTGAEGEVLNTLGMAQIALGQVEEGSSCLREAIAIARKNDDVDGLGYAYANLADSLNLAGRMSEALDTAREGMSANPRRPSRERDWMTLVISELEFETGDWELARSHLGPPPSRLVGVLLIFRALREAELALGVGDEELAERWLQEAAPLVQVSSEPQWIGLLGALLGELRRRQRDLAGAREAVAEALDRMELCTDDVMRIARVTAVGVRVEADFAQRARDLREKADERSALARARIHMQRLRAAAQEGGPVEGACLAFGAAELTRARGRSDPARWLAAAREWDAITRPYPAAMARWRAAEAYVERGDRGAATEAAQAALAAARKLGSRWLTEEVEALAERGRLDLADRADPGTASSAAGVAESDPFGLTAREHQVLALIAEGATNRQIGAALYMAEKTASVHVSRILRKLGVTSRTQAAAVAHRLHLV